MMNAVGGTSIHWMTQSWRYLPWNFKVRSETIKRYGASALAAARRSPTGPSTYEDLEPWYDKVEYRHGVSGQAGNVKGKIDPKGNVFEGPRSRPYPLPAAAPQRLDAEDVRRGQGHGPQALHRARPGIRSARLQRLRRLHLLRLLRLDGVLDGRQGATNLHFIPQAEKTGNLKLVDMARVLEINVDKDGKASGVTYLKGGKMYFQPAKASCSRRYTYENVRLLLLSKSKAYPNGLSNNKGQVGKNYIGHGLSSASASGVFKGQRLNRYAGTIGQFTAIDDWDADNFDHTGLGFISGGMVSAGMEVKPIGTADTLPPSAPTWGVGLHAVAVRERRLGRRRLGADGGAARTRRTTSISIRR